MFGPLVTRQGADHGVDALTDKFRLEILVAKSSDFSQEFVNHLKAYFFMGQFTTTELQVYFHLHVLAKEVDGVAGLDP